jgi:hypothetical protein
MLKDKRVLRSLRDASHFLLSLSERSQHNPWNQYAADLFLEAARSGEDIEEATVQMRRAPSREGVA